MRSLTVVPIQRQLVAAILSAALAVSTVFPPASIALVGQEQEGGVDPGPVTPDSTTNPDFDPGGEDELPFEVGVPADPGDEGPPVESEPVDDPDALAVPLDQPEDETTDLAAPPLTSAPPAPPPAATPPVATPPAADLPAPPAVEAAPPPTAPQRHAAAEPSKGRDRAAARKRQRARADRGASTPLPAAPRAVATIPAPAAKPAPVPVAAAALPPTPTVAVDTRVPPVERGSRTYTVQHGDCLWTIAVALFGNDLERLTEPERNTRIQARVERLYALNQDRIGPDANMVNEGTVLRLR